ncbi:MAG: hypothetical protein CMH83_21035 [Nocardioides sp.]|nr:hypothetical protein [Nocardioides sp.]
MHRDHLPKTRDLHRIIEGCGYSTTRVGRLYWLHDSSGTVVSRSDGSTIEELWATFFDLALASLRP